MRNIFRDKIDLSNFLFNEERNPSTGKDIRTLRQSENWKSSASLRGESNAGERNFSLRSIEAVMRDNTGFFVHLPAVRREFVRKGVARTCLKIGVIFASARRSKRRVVSVFFIQKIYKSGHFFCL